jgi:hypothetical protein
MRVREGGREREGERETDKDTHPIFIRGDACNTSDKQQ